MNRKHRPPYLRLVSLDEDTEGLQLEADLAMTKAELEATKKELRRLTNMNLALRIQARTYSN